MKIFSVFLTALALSVTALGFPQVMEWKKKPIVVYENKKLAVLKKNEFLKLPFAVIAGADDLFDFKLNGFDRVLIYPATKVQVLEIAEETGFVPELYLLDGQIRFSANFRGKGKEEKSVLLKTPFFDLKLAENADFLVELDMKAPAVTVKVITGSVPLEFFAFEKKLVLDAGQSVRFNGVLADDKLSIRYDFLLNNRKAPQGTLSEVEKFDQSLFLKKEEEAVRDELKRKKDSLKKAAEAEKKRRAFEAAFLCKNPLGQKDQCAWRLESGKCFRQRCNVSGKWGDRTERPIQPQCKKNFYVAECDY